MATTITVKGQVTVPKAVRDHLGLSLGSRVEFALDDDGRVVVRRASDAAPRPVDRFDRATGMGTALKGMSTDEIMKLLRGDDD